MRFRSTKAAIEWFIHWQASSKLPRPTYARNGNRRADGSYDSDLVTGIDLERMLSRFPGIAQVLLFDWALHGADEALKRFEQRIRSGQGKNIIPMHGNENNMLGYYCNQTTRALRRAGYLRKRQTQKVGIAA